MVRSPLSRPGPSSTSLTADTGPSLPARNLPGVLGPAPPGQGSELSLDQQDITIIPDDPVAGDAIGISALVAETMDIETQKLEASLEIQDADGQVVHEDNLQASEQIQDDTYTFEFAEWTEKVDAGDYSLDFEISAHNAESVHADKDISVVPGEHIEYTIEEALQKDQLADEYYINEEESYVQDDSQVANATDTYENIKAIIADAENSSNIDISNLFDFSISDDSNYIIDSADKAVILNADEISITDEYINLDEATELRDLENFDGSYSLYDNFETLWNNQKITDEASGYSLSEEQGHDFGTLSQEKIGFIKDADNYDEGKNWLWELPKSELKISNIEIGEVISGESFTVEASIAETEGVQTEGLNAGVLLLDSEFQELDAKELDLDEIQDEGTKVNFEELNTETDGIYVLVTANAANADGVSAIDVPSKVNTYTQFQNALDLHADQAKEGETISIEVANDIGPESFEQEGPLVYRGSNDLHIQAAGDEIYTIDAGNHSRILGIDTPGEVAMEGLSLQNGDVGGPYYGDAVFAKAGSMDVSEVIFENNAADTVLRGNEQSNNLLGGNADDQIVVVGDLSLGGKSESEETTALLGQPVSNLEGKNFGEDIQGGVIDGGNGENTLHVFGKVDLTQYEIDNIDHLELHSDATLTEQKLEEFETISGDGKSIIRILPENKGQEVTYKIEDKDQIQDIGQFHLAEGVTLEVDEEEHLGGAKIFSGKGTLKTNQDFGSMQDYSLTKDIEVDGSDPSEAHKLHSMGSAEKDSDVITGTEGDDYLEGHVHGSVFNGKQGNDVLAGKEGDDRFIVTPGTKTIISAAGGEDTLDFSQAEQDLTVDLSAGGDIVSGDWTNVYLGFDDAVHTGALGEQVHDSHVNLLAIVDTSGSMGWGRLNQAKDALHDLLDTYEDHVSLAVGIVEFASSANAITNDQGDFWYNTEDAASIIEGLSSGGATNFQAGLQQGEAVFSSGENHAIFDPSGKNVSFFLSDGNPNSYVNNYSEQDWQDFVSKQDIVSRALGAGSSPTLSNLNPVAYDGIEDKNIDATADLDFGELGQKLKEEARAETDFINNVQGSPHVDDITGNTLDNRFILEKGQFQTEDCLDGFQGTNILELHLENDFKGFAEEGGISNIQVIEVHNATSEKLSFDGNDLEEVEKFVFDAGDGDLEMDLGSLEDITVSVKGNGGFSENSKIIASGNNVVLNHFSADDSPPPINDFSSGVLEGVSAIEQENGVITLDADQLEEVGQLRGGGSPGSRFNLEGQGEVSLEELTLDDLGELNLKDQVTAKIGEDTVQEVDEIVGNGTVQLLDEDLDLDDIEISEDIELLGPDGEEISTDDELSLLEKYAPALALTEDEPFIPTKIEAFLDHSVLWNNHRINDPHAFGSNMSGNTEDLFSRNFNEDDFPTLNTENWKNIQERLNDQEPDDSLSYIDFANQDIGSDDSWRGTGKDEEVFVDDKGGRLTYDPVNIQEKEPYGPAVYGREIQAEDDGPTYLQYHFHWLYDSWVQDHEGDWEFMQIRLDDNQNPDLLMTSIHHDESAVRKYWDLDDYVVPMEDGSSSFESGRENLFYDFSSDAQAFHPLVYPGEEGHPTYLSSGETTPKGPDWTKHFGIPSDDHEGDGNVLLPSHTFNSGDETKEYELIDVGQSDALQNFLEMDIQWGYDKPNLTSPPPTPGTNEDGRWDNPGAWLWSSNDGAERNLLDSEGYRLDAEAQKVHSYSYANVDEPGVYWAVRDFDLMDANHHFLRLQPSSPEDFNKSKDFNGDGDLDGFTIGAGKDKEKEQLDAYVNSESDLDAISNPNSWRFQDYKIPLSEFEGDSYDLLIENLMTAYDAYEANTQEDPVDYALLPSDDKDDGNCATWVNTILQESGVSSELSENIDDDAKEPNFEGKNKGHDKKIASHYFQENEEITVQGVQPEDDMGTDFA